MESCIHRDLGCGIFMFLLFHWVCWKETCIHRDIGCWTFMLLLFHWFRFLEKAWRSGMCILVRDRRSGLDSWIHVCSVSRHKGWENAGCAFWCRTEGLGWIDLLGRFRYGHAFKHGQLPL
jgi:hypothetical protein